MNENIERLQRLTKYLFISGTLNIFLLLVVVSLLIRDNPPVPYYEHKPLSQSEKPIAQSMPKTGGQLMRMYRCLSLDQLANKLNDAGLAADGYTKRDLTLACMVSVHHFDLDKALAGLPGPVKKELFTYGLNEDGTPAEAWLFPGLANDHFLAIQRYIHKEKWPLTSKGLFLKMQNKHRKGESFDLSLADAFYTTPEFLALESLFARSKISLKKNDLLKMALEGEWDILSHFFQQQRKHQDLSNARRLGLLKDYISQGSQSAGKILHKLKEGMVHTKLAKSHLLKNQGNIISHKERQYIVQEGDSLWKISRQYNVNMELIKKSNNLENDILKPGTLLKIP